MAKPRTKSDPPPTEPPDQYHIQHAMSSTLPARVSHRMRMAEPFPTISASMLLSLDVSHSGWVRKEGYGYKNWKNRFMVLHHGCIYYFKETDSNAPKGKFPLNGFSCLLAEDRDGVDRYPYVFKLVPENKQLRTYYISSPSKIEMEGWMNSINEDIQKYTPSDYDYVETDSLGISSTCPTVPRNIPSVGKRGTSDNHNGRPILPHSFSASDIIRRPTPLLPPTPPVDVNDEEDDGLYEPVHEFQFQTEDHYVKVLNNDEPDGSLRSSAEKQTSKAQSLNNGRPAPPARPKPPPPPRPPEMNSESDGEDSEEDLYLDLVKENMKKSRSRSVGSLLENGPTAISPDRERPMPTPPVPNESLDVCEDSVTEVLYVPFVEGRCNVPPKPKPRKKKLEEKKPGEFEYLPSECWRPEMPKHQAKIYLELGRTIGEYIINCSQTSDTKMSLSVWLESGVKHYLIFKRQEKFTLDPSLTAEEHFSDVRQLVKYYFTHPLPKSGQHLKMPFATKQ